MLTFNSKQSAAFLSICSNSILIILKFFVGFLTGSLSIISEALHSLSDIIASFIAFLSVLQSSKPADKNHPFGHGKFEEISGLLEGVLICIIAVFIFYSAIIKIFSHTVNNIEPFWGIVIMAFSVVLNIFVSKYLFNIGKKTNSIAIIADAEHLKTDVLSSMAILGGLLIIKFTGLNIIDTILAIFVSIIIMIAGIKLIIATFKSLTDEALPQKDLDILQDILNKHTEKNIENVKSINTRKSGSEKIIDIIIVVNCDMTIKDGHDICNSIEQEIIANLKGAKVFIHLEPSEDNNKVLK